MLAELVADPTRDDLLALIDKMADTMLALIAACTDADVAFIPGDPEAHDWTT